jgi:hypothetical protein
MAKNDELNLDDIDDASPEAPSQLRQFAERAAAKGAKADALEREVTLLRYGIDTSSKLGQAFLATLDVDITNKDAVLEAAKEFPGIIRGTEPAATTEGTTTEGTTTEPTIQATGSEQRNALSDGALPSGAAVQDEATASVEAARKALELGANEQEAMGGMIAARARAVHEGKLEPLPSNGRRPQYQ